MTIEIKKVNKREAILLLHGERIGEALQKRDAKVVSTWLARAIEEVSTVLSKKKVSKRTVKAMKALEDDPYPGYVTGSDTSEAAAESIKGFAGSLRYRILQYILSRGQEGATDDEIERFFGMRHQTVSARRRELVQQGHIETSELRRRTSSGRTATVWKAVE